MSNPFPSPLNLPEPIDDRACRHVKGMRPPAMALASTGGRMHELFENLGLKERLSTAIQ